MLRKIIINFVHDCGSRCILTVDEKSDGARLSFSFRDSRGMRPETVDAWTDVWAEWGKLAASATAPPPLPPGWNWG